MFKGLLHRKHDPITEHARDIDQQLANLQDEIERLNISITETKNTPHVKSTVFPKGAAHPQSQKQNVMQEPVFESTNHKEVMSQKENPENPAHFNEMGLRKFDITALWARIAKLFRAPPPANPKFINYLAAGSIQGLPPLRNERRAARNRVLLLLIIFVLVISWVIMLLSKNR